MAKSNNERLLDAQIARRLLLFRHEATIRAEIDRLLDTLERAIRDKLVEIEPGGVARDTYKSLRILKLIDEVEALIGAAYKDIWAYHREQLTGMAEAEAIFLVTQVNALIERNAATLKSGQWATLVKDTLMTGAPLRDWWNGQSDSIKEKFAQQMRMGLLQNETDEQLIDRVRGTKMYGYKDGLMAVSKRLARILVRGASASVSAEARKVAIRDNPRVFRGIQQISVFDGRTSQVCIAYAGKVWTVPGYQPVGHAMPYNGGVPRHPNCRSSEIAVLTEAFGGSPAQDMSFDEFLDGKSPAAIDAMIGKGKGALYRSGKITLNDLVDQTGRGVTLEELRG